MEPGNKRSWATFLSRCRRLGSKRPGMYRHNFAKRAIFFESRVFDERRHPAGWGFRKYGLRNVELQGNFSALKALFFHHGRGKYLIIYMLTLFR